MEITYKVSMRQHGADEKWIVMDSGNENSMRTTLKFYRKMQGHRNFRLEKHTMEVIDD